MFEAENFSDPSRTVTFICAFIADKSNINPYKSASMIVSANDLPTQNTAGALILI
jgi:hypothetical protein